MRVSDSVNVVGTVALADACWKRNIPLTVFATGCIYEVLALVITHD
mgnify:FL=1